MSTIHELLAAGSPGPWLAGSWQALLVGLVGVAALVVSLLAFAGPGRRLGGRVRRAARSLLSGADNRGSTSKVVAAAWTLLVAWMLLSGAILKLAVGVGLTDLSVSNDYLVLLGGPFAAAVLAKGIVVTRLANGTLQKSAAPDDSKLSPGDVIRDDAGRTDLVDFQYTLFNALTLVVVAVMFVLRPELGLPDVPAGLLALTGTAAAAYVANKAVSTGTPRITRVDPGTARPGQAVVLRGTNLVASGTGAAAQPPAVSVNDLLAPLVGEAGAQSVTVRVPTSAAVSAPGAPAVVVLVSDAAGLARAEGTLTIESDGVVLSQVAPATAAPDDQVTLTGRGFLAAQAVAPSEEVSVDPPVVLLAAPPTADRPARDLARVSPMGPPAGSLPGDTSLTFVMPHLTVDPATRLTVTVARGGLSSQPLQMMLGALRGSAHQAGVIGLRDVDASEGFDLGVGVATISGQRMPGVRAVTADTPRDPAGDDTGVYSRETRLTICQNSREVASALDVSVDAEASYGALSTSDKFQLAEKCQQTEAHLFLVVQARARSPLLTATNVRLTSEAQQLIGNADYPEFLRTYGDAFVSGLVRGGEYSAVLAIDISGDVTSQKIVNEFGVSGSIGDFSASVQNTVTSTLSKHNDSLHMTMMVTSRGGDPLKYTLAPAATQTSKEAVAQDVSDVLSAARNFPDSVTPKNAYPLSANLTEYVHLDLVNGRGFLDYLESPQGLDEPRRTLAEMARWHTTMVDDLAQARALLNKPFGYTEAPGEILRRFQKIEKELRQAIDELPDLAGDYAYDVVRHGDSSRVSRPQYTPPTPTWPTPKAVPVYVLKAAFGQGTLVAAASPVDPPGGGEPTNVTGSIRLANYRADDPSQLWHIETGSDGVFTMQNTYTRLYAAWPGFDAPLTQTSTIDTNAATWKHDAAGWIVTALQLPFGVGPWYLNAVGDGPWLENTPVGIWHNGNPENSHFQLISPDDLNPPAGTVPAPSSASRAPAPPASSPAAGGIWPTRTARVEPDRSAARGAQGSTNS